MDNIKPAMYIFVNRGLNMSPGKIGAQVGHAVARMVMYHTTGDQSQYRAKLWAAWNQAKHETKLIMLAEDEQHMNNIERYLNDRGFVTEQVIDEGRTEIRPHSLTALSVEIVDKADPDVIAVFESFQTYKEAKPKTEKSWWQRWTKR